MSAAGHPAAFFFTGTEFARNLNEIAIALF
jgi:hypothetical protein